MIYESAEGGREADERASLLIYETASTLAAPARSRERLNAAGRAHAPTISPSPSSSARRAHIDHHRRHHIVVGITYIYIHTHTHTDAYAYREVYTRAQLLQQRIRQLYIISSFPRTKKKKSKKKELKRAPRAGDRRRRRRALAGSLLCRSARHSVRVRNSPGILPLSSGAAFRAKYREKERVCVVGAESRRLDTTMWMAARRREPRWWRDTACARVYVRARQWVTRPREEGRKRERENKRDRKREREVRRNCPPEGLVIPFLFAVCMCGCMWIEPSGARKHWWKWLKVGGWMSKRLLGGKFWVVYIMW